MKRIAGLVMAWGLVLFALAPTASAAQGVISVSPPSGPAGIAATVIISGFVGGVPVEVHAGSAAGVLLGSGTTNPSGIAGIPITIPDSAPPGPYVIYACGSCSSEIPSNQATTTYDVIPPTTPTTTPTTTPATTTTTEPPPAPGEPCAIPDGAFVVDFDDVAPGSGLLADSDSALYRAVSHALLGSQFHHDSPGVFNEDGTVTKTSHAPRRDGESYVADNPANDLWTSSPPNVLRSIGVGVFSVDAWSPFRWQRSTSEDRDLTTTVRAWQMNGQLDYVGFNVGFGHFGEGFPDVEEVVVELVVEARPIQLDDGTIILGAMWDPVTVTLGPGPQPVTTCLMAVNTTGPTDRWTSFNIDVRPQRADGVNLSIPVDIDDFFYGVYAPPVPFDAGDPAIPTSTLLEPMPGFSDPESPAGSGASGPSDWPVRIAFGIAGLILGAGSLLAFRKT